MGGARLRALQLRPRDASGGAAGDGIVRDASGAIELQAALVGTAQGSCMLTVAEIVTDTGDAAGDAAAEAAGDAAGEAGGSEGGGEGGGGGGGARAASSSEVGGTAATAQGRRVRRRP